MKNDSDRVLVTDHLTGKTTVFFSQAECARKMNLDKSLVSWRLKQPRDRIYDKRYSFAFDQQRERIKYASSPKKVILIDLITGEIFEYDSLAKSADRLGLSVAALKKRFGRGCRVFGNLVMVVYSPAMGEIRPNIDIEQLRNTYMSAPLVIDGLLAP